MAQAAKCDRCGQFFEPYDVNRQRCNVKVEGLNTIILGSWNKTDGYFSKKTYELCTDCCKEFNEWLEEANE